MFFPIPKQAVINNKENSFRKNFQMFYSNSLIHKKVGVSFAFAEKSWFVPLVP